MICQILLEAGDELLKVTEPVVDERLFITLDRKKLQTVGKEAIENFLLKLQVGFASYSDRWSIISTNWKSSSMFRFTNQRRISKKRKLCLTNIREFRTKARIRGCVGAISCWSTNNRGNCSFNRIRMWSVRVAVLRCALQDFPGHLNFCAILAPTGDDEDVELKTYESTHEGLIESWVDRYPDREVLYAVLSDLADKDGKHFKY